MRAILKGATDQSVVIRIVDDTTGQPETGVTSATSGLDLKYRREGATTANLTESDLSALNDAHSDGGMLHIGAGYYRVDVPDAAFATGADGVLIFGTVTDMVVIAAYHPLVGETGRRKNAALADFTFPMFDEADGSLLDGLTVSAEVSLDGGAFAAMDNDPPTEIGTTGVYHIDATAADRNGTVVVWKFTAAGARPLLVTFVMEQ